MAESRRVGFSKRLAAIRFCAFAAMAVCSFVSTNFVEIKSGIDHSWRYAINLDVQWGTDIVLTYGPLGFLLWTVNLNHHVLISGLFWGAVYLYVVWMLWQFFFSEKSPVPDRPMPIIIYTALFCISAAMVDLERFVCFVAMFSLLLAYKIDRRYSIGCSIFLLLSFYMKASLAVQILSGYLLFTLMLWIGKKKDRLFYTAGLLAPILLFPVTFLLFYCRSVSSLWKYVYGTLQMSSGYNAAMSGSWDDIYALWIVLIVACYFISCIIMMVKKAEDLPFAVALLGPLFFAYKHGFVRADQYHFIYSFPMLLLLTAPFLLACDRDFLKQGGRGRELCNSLYTTCISVILIVCFIFTKERSPGFLSSLKERTLDLPGRIHNMADLNMDDLYILPQDVLDCIGSETVCIYPWELSYAASNDLNCRLLPAVQAYSAYTPYLDRLDADFFAAEDGPAYIILETDTIDKRWPLAECPQTWIAIQDHYELALRNDTVLLMKRKEGTETKSYGLAYTNTVEKGQIIAVDSSGAYVYKIEAELSLWGKMVSLFWKIPKVDMTVNYVDGSNAAMRVLLDNLAGGADLSHMFLNEGMLDEYLNGSNREFSAVSSIVFSGDGLKYYKDNIIVETYEITE